MDRLLPEVRFQIVVSLGGRVWGEVIDPATPPLQQDVRFLCRRKHGWQTEYTDAWYECVTCTAHLGFEYFKTSIRSFPDIAMDTDDGLVQGKLDALRKEMMDHAENHAKLAHVALSILRSQGYTMRKS